MSWSSMIQPSCYSDVAGLCETWKALHPLNKVHHAMFECALKELYDAEWRKRGFSKSP